MDAPEVIRVWPSSSGGRVAFYSTWAVAFVASLWFFFAIKSEWRHRSEHQEQCERCGHTRLNSDQYLHPLRPLEWHLAASIQQRACQHVWRSSTESFTVMLSSYYMPVRMLLSPLLLLGLTVMALRAGLAQRVLMPRLVSAIAALLFLVYALAVIDVMPLVRAMDLYREASGSGFVFEAGDGARFTEWVMARVWHGTSTALAFILPAVWVWRRRPTPG